MIMLDTNVLSELMRPQPSLAVIAWVDAQKDEDLFISAITMAEILHGIARLPTGKRKGHLHKLASAMFEEDFAGRIVPFDACAAPCYAQWVARCEAAGKPASLGDAQIAATCIAQGARLATRNVKDFAEGDLQLINPWLFGES